MLAEDLAEWPDDAWLVIDDYHFAMGSLASELFSSNLVSRLPSVRLLITSRRRPLWSTARRRVYGEFFELARESLTMSEGEAHEVLAGHDDVSSVIQQAAGWPAVLGLAALSGGAFTTLSSTLRSLITSLRSSTTQWSLACSGAFVSWRSHP